MLVLTRRISEEIRIGDDIIITIVEIDRGKVRLGIQAPREIPIVRCELEEDNDNSTKHPTK